MASRSPFLILLAPALALGACSGENRGLESVHQPIVSRSEYVLDLATAGYGLAPGEPQRLAGWLSSLRLGYGDRLFIDEGDGGATDAREIVAGEAARYGLLLSEGVPVTAGGVGPGLVRVVVTRMTAAVPGCPDFRRPEAPNFTGHTGYNYGCASNSNLANMVANPADLVRGEPGTETTDPAVAIKAIEQFRKAPPTGAQPLKEQRTGGGSQ